MNTKRVNPWAALGALCLGLFMILLDTTIVSVAIPAMLTGLDAGLNAVVWVTSVYLLTFAVPMLLSSRLGDRFGPRQVFLAGLVVFTGASLWCGLSGTAEMLIAARAAQGLGAAMMTPQTLAFISHLFGPAQRGAAMGMWGGIAGLATITGPLLGGVLVDHLGWEWIFFVNVPIGLVAIVLTLALVPNWQPRHAHSFDLFGILLSAAGLFCLVFGVQNGQQYDWGVVTGSVTVFEIIGAGVLLLAGFVLWQRFNRKEPLLPLRVFANHNFTAGTISSAVVGFALIAMNLPLMLYLQAVLGLSPTETGLLMLPMSLLSAGVAPFAGLLSDRTNPKYLLMAGLVALAAGLGVLAAQAQTTTAPLAFVPAMLVIGLGVGCIFSPMGTVTMGSVSPELTGTASGIYNTARQIGGVFGSAVTGVLMQARVTASTTAEARHAAESLPPEYRTGFLEGIRDAAASNSEFGGAAATAPPGLPADVAAQFQRLGADVIHNGLTSAAKVTLLLPIAVLLAGAAFALTIRRHSPALTPTNP
ncbi:DHA2 family efflux MFS transporter permease subunit [Amycolatopsis nigrescens]|uniref:DHA2 family efflux MFS transporter permease subunit n=1 Tax=Amycolatopsis nigrescens TaxID=381445 RepID=UPI00036E2E46|nr:DHA2 family efflux MFS transporter permease subunit [Amycolatopsis nigrescens]